MKEFSVVITVADENPAQIDFCLTNFREHYPDIPVHVVSDGVPKLHEKVAEKHNAAYTLGRYLKRIECGGQWWHRTLTTGLQYNTPWIFKIDPDTRFWRKFKSFPETPVGGTHDNVGKLTEHLQGGCQAFRREAVETILGSGILESEALTFHSTFCPNQEALKSWIPTGYFTTDFSMMYILRKLSIPFANWTEVGARWKVAPPNFDMRFAVTHPHKITEDDIGGIPDSEPIHVIVTCKGRLHHLKESLPRLLAEPNVQVTVVDYDCPQRTAAWVKANHKGVRVVQVRDKPKFNLADARNQGAKQTPPGWWCFMDADILVNEGWATAVRAVLQKKYYYVAQPLKWGMTGTVVVHSENYKRTGGYDSVMRGWACEDLDFYARLRQVGVRPRFWDGNFASIILHSDEERTKFYDKAKSTSVSIGSEYYRSKMKLMLQKWSIPTYEERVALWKAAEKALSDGKIDTTQVVHSSGGYDEGKPPVKVPAKPKEPILVTGVPIPSGKDKQEIPQTPTFPTPTPYFFTPLKRALQMLPISVINHSSIDLGLTLDQLCALGESYLANVVTRYWYGTAAHLIPATEMMPKTQCIVLMDDNAQNENVLGYQTLTPDGYPLSRVFVKNALRFGIPVTQVFTHELTEMRVNPGINLEATDQSGIIYALEPCDPVEGDTFIHENYPVSNLVTPAWFQPFHRPGSTLFDHMGLIAEPFSISKNGYAMVFDPKHGCWSEKFGSHDKKMAYTSHHRIDIRKDSFKCSGRHCHRAYAPKRPSTV